MAAFDVDETLIWEKSMFSFLRFFLQAEHGSRDGATSYNAFTAGLNTLSKSQPREVVNREFYKIFQGVKASRLDDLAQDWFAQMPGADWFIPEVLTTLRMHQHLGHRIVLVSGSARFILNPIAAYIGADDVLGINLEMALDGIYTGQIDGIQTIGHGKCDALHQLMNADPHDPVSSTFGYGDHESDVPFLAACDTGFIVWRDGPDQRPDWTQNFHPMFVNSNARHPLTLQTESYANV
jgi:HAD superfamily hydrolase (TIGR01490 family)